MPQELTIIVQPTTVQSTTVPPAAAPESPQDEIIVDGPRLARAFRRQGRLWLWLGPLAVALLLLLALTLVPRSYTAIVSVAVQQSSGGSSALALLAGGSGPNKRYIGVLKSRMLAAQVERRVGLRQLYGPKHFRTEQDAVEFLMKSIKPNDDSTDSLLYISVTLPGPSKLALHPVPTETQIKEAAAECANQYALALKEYYIANDTDQGAVLLRGADKQVKQARGDFDRAETNLLDFSRGLSRVDPRSAPTSASDTPGSTDAEAAVTGLGTLYTALAQVEAELRAAQVARATGQALVGQQLRDLSTIPTDDPLLSDARSRVTQDQAAYNTAVRLYGPENPRVVQAQAQLAVDQAQLDQQIQGVKRQLTTPNIRSTEQIQSLYARQGVLNSQIAQAERRLGVHRQLSGEFGRLQTEAGIQLEVLKATLTEAAKVRLDNASALNRMSIVDTAVPPKTGEPGAAKLGIGALLIVLLLFLTSVILDYMRSGQAKFEAGSLNSNTNGVGSEPRVPNEEVTRL